MLGYKIIPVEIDAKIDDMKGRYRTYMSSTLKIIEINVQSINVKNKHKYIKLIEEIVNQKADIIVLTEITCAQRDILSYLLEISESNYNFASTSNQTPNGVCIIASSEKIEKVLFQDIRTYRNSRKNKNEEEKSTIYPDALFATIYLKSGIKFCLMGTRLSVSKLTKAEYKTQIQKFYDAVKVFKPRLIIGDFNWDTAIKPYVESKKECINEEDKFCSNIGFNGNAKVGTRKAKFSMWPQSQIIENADLCSHISKRNKKGKTCPDRVVYDYNTVEITCSYYPILYNDRWLFDHAILVCKVKI